jgi:hypothetical protein
MPSVRPSACPERGLQALSFGVAVDAARLAGHGLDAGQRLAQHVGQAAVESAHDTRHRVGLVAQQAARGHQHAAVEIGHELGVLQEAQLGQHRGAGARRCTDDGADVAEHAVHVVGPQHLLGHRSHAGQGGLHTHPRAIDAGGAAERAEGVQGNVARMADDGAAFQVLRRADRAVGAHRDGRWRGIEQHVHADRRGLRLPGRDLDQRIDITVGQIVRTLHHARCGGVGAGAGGEVDLQALARQVAVVARQQQPRLRA